jgi:hypothetical protein
MPEATPTAGSAPLAGQELAHVLGQHVLHTLRATLEAQLATALAQLMPQMLDTVRDVVRAQLPELLEVLLQREIAQLKHAVEQDQHDG